MALLIQSRPATRYLSATQQLNLDKFNQLIVILELSRIKSSLETLVLINRYIQIIQNCSFNDQFQSSGEFDKLTHQTAKYDIYGLPKKIEKKPGQDERNILKDPIKIPQWWSKPTGDSLLELESNKKTRTKLIQDRKQDLIPHISYDLDNDGYVGGRDLVIAKYFDQDKDGRLNTAEKDNAIKALREGFENQFVWGIEQSGPTSLHRIMQKRGQIVHAEDFQSIRETYPVHPLTTKDPENKTLGEVKQKRKLANITDYERQKKLWDEANPSHIAQKKTQPEFYVEQPPYTSIQDLKDRKLLESRVSVGLLPKFIDIKDSSKDPTLKYIQNPSISCKSELNLKRHQENYEEFKKTEALQGLHKDGMHRLKEREDCFLRLNYKDVDGKTKRQLAEERKKDMLDYNMKTFGKVSIGVHGKELPKYSETNDPNVREWWKLKQGYNDKPGHYSQKILKQTHKTWAKTDLMLLQDVVPEAGPVDPFKTEHVKQIKKTDVHDKVTKIFHFKSKDTDNIMAENEGPGIKKSHNYKWTTVENQFSRKKKRLFDELADAQPTRADLMPLYSSFNPKGIFKPPQSSKDLQVSVNIGRDNLASSQSNRARTINQSVKQINNQNQDQNMMNGIGSINQNQNDYVNPKSLNPQGNTLFNRVSTSQAGSRALLNPLAQQKQVQPVEANQSTIQQGKIGNQGSLGSTNFRQNATLGIRSGAFNGNSKENTQTQGQQSPATYANRN